VLVASLYAILLTWWVQPLARTTGSGFDFIVFDLHGIVPIGYALFAVALGVFAGALTRKVLAGMAATLAGFVAVRAVVMFLARPYFLAPLERRFPVATASVPNPASGDWLLSHALYDKSGNLEAANGYAFCAPSPRCPDDGTYNLIAYQPGSRFWLFQYLETGIYVVLAAALLYLAVRLVRRRIT
jgi:hypothetical protein